MGTAVADPLVPPVAPANPASRTFAFNEEQLDVITHLRSSISSCAMAFTATFATNVFLSCAQVGDREPHSTHAAWHSMALQCLPHQRPAPEFLHSRDRAHISCGPWMPGCRPLALPTSQRQLMRRRRRSALATSRLVMWPTGLTARCWSCCCCLRWDRWTLCCPARPTRCARCSR